MPSELLPGVETEAELQYFEEELEINDFPQQIRYRICSRVFRITFHSFVRYLLEVNLDVVITEKVEPCFKFCWENWSIFFTGQFGPSPRIC